MNERKQSKISIQLKKKLLGVDQWPNIIRMLIYMSIHSEDKKQYINRILSLS